MLVFMGVFEEKVQREVQLCTYRDDNGIWLNITTKEGLSMRVNLDHKTCLNMGNALTNLGRAIS